MSLYQLIFDGVANPGPRGQVRIQRLIDTLSEGEDQSRPVALLQRVQISFDRTNVYHH